MLLNEKNFDEIIAKMSIEEKLQMLTGGKGFSSLAMVQYGITEITMCDSHNGINLMQRIADIVQQVMVKFARSGKGTFGKNEIIGHLFTIGKSLGGLDGTNRLLRGDISDEDLSGMPQATAEFARNFITALKDVLPDGHCPTCYPSGMNMGATWDRSLMRECGEKIGEEAQAFDIDMLLAPTVNIQRDARNGRWFESYSEDPYLMGELIVPYIEGVQSHGVLTTVKHFACNNQETLRHEIDVIISERALREIYLPAFKKAAIEAESHALMTSYNSVNGEFASQNNHLLKDILRDEWGYKGMVVSDWNGVYDKTAALRAGNDLEMPGPTDRTSLLTALESGELTEQQIDENLRYILRAVTKTNRFQKVEKKPVDMSANAMISHRMAEESIVLLKNNGVLPFQKSEKIAVLGVYAKNTLSCGTGSSGIISDYVVSVYAGMRDVFEYVSYFDSAEAADLVNHREWVYVIGENVGEGSDRESLAISSDQHHLLAELCQRKQACGARLTVILNTPGPVEIAEFEPFIDALLYLGFAGQECGAATASILVGDTNPSAKLTATYPRYYKDTPTFLNFPGEFHKVVYGEGIYVGYRYYDKKQQSVLYPFGHGLSYTQFEYQSIELEKDLVDLEADEKVMVQVRVKNTGSVAGKEIIQLYVRDIASTIDRPIKELKCFEKIALLPGEEKTVKFVLDRDSFAFFDTNLGQFVVEPGEFDVLLGASCDDIRLTKRVEVLCNNPYSIDLSTSIRTIMEDQEMVVKLKAVLPEGFFELPGIQIELIYHPELSIGQCISKYMAESFELDETAVDEYKKHVVEVLTSI
ncbi:glycoside hydrolase family 3 N-terminal domain-containing protein [Paenibacillus sp. CMAA1364]